jgi:hypothetical protein
MPLGFEPVSINTLVKRTGLRKRVHRIDAADSGAGRSIRTCARRKFLLCPKSCDE